MTLGAVGWNQTPHPPAGDQGSSNDDDAALEAVIDGDAQLQDALASAAVAELDEEASPPPTSHQVLTPQHRVDDQRLLRLLSGKTTEAMSWLIGNNGIKYREYKRYCRALNFYIGRLQEAKYPSYGKIIRIIKDILDVYVTTKTCQMVAGVNTTRSGVNSRLISARRNGETPSTSFQIVLPSEWAKKDALYCEYLTNTMQFRLHLPRCVYIENAPIVSPFPRCNMPHSINEVFCSPLGYTYGKPVWERDAVCIGLLGPKSVVDRLIEEEECITGVSESAGLELAEFRGIIGPTSFAETGASEETFSVCDANTRLLKCDGTSWNDAYLLHRFSPGPGVRSTALILRDGSGNVLELRWSFLRRIEIVGVENRVLPPQCKHFGILRDGRHFAVMRVLLYSDDFKPYEFKQASCGGFYLLPLSIPPWARLGLNAIRIIGLTPPGVHSSKAISAVIDDIVRGSTAGIPVTMNNGSQLTVFLDAVGYIGDYPEISHLLDVTGVGGVAPCSFCTFRRANTRSGESGESGEAVTQEGSSYAYSTAVHSANLSFRRTRERMAVCRRNANEQQLKKYGLRQCSEEELQNMPLHRLSAALEQVRANVPLRADGGPVVPCFFDPYLSCVVAPDHVLHGVGEDICTAMLKRLGPDKRTLMNVLAMQAMTTAGFSDESSFLASRTLKINQMAFSSFTAFLHVVPWSMRTASGLPSPTREVDEATFFAMPITDAILHTLYHYQDLYFSTVRVPVEAVDSQAAVDKMDGAHWDGYISTLQDKATSFVRKINWLCKRHPETRKVVDKPNVHRVLELYFHSIPRFGHVSLIQELLLEGGHQPLKRGISRSNQHAPHIHAMTRVLADDWMRRIGEAVCLFEDVNNLTDEDCHTLADVGFGRADAITSGLVSCDDIRQSFPSFVLREFQSLALSTHNLTRRRTVWIGRKKKKNAPPPPIDRAVASFLRALLCSSSNPNDLIFYESAVRARGIAQMSDGEGNEMLSLTHRSNERNCIRRGGVVQILLEPDEIVRERSSNVVLLKPSEKDGCRTFWRVCEFYGVKGKDDVYVHLQQMIRVDAGHEFESSYRLDCDSSVKFVIKLTEHIRRALALHECLDGSRFRCTYTRSTGAFHHSEDDADSIYVLRGSGDGFPSRAR